MKAVVAALWTKYQWEFAKQTVLYAVWLVCFTVYADAVARWGGRLFEGSHPFNGTGSVLVGAIHATSLASSVVLELYFLRREIRQHNEEQTAKVAFWTEPSFWNCLQRSTHILFWAVLIVNFVVWGTNNATLTASGSSGTTDGTTVLDVLRFVTAFCVIMMWIGWLHYFRGYVYTSVIIRMFTSIYSDFPKFFIVVFVQVIGFAIGFRLIYSGYKEDDQSCVLVDEEGGIGICDEVQTGYDSFWRSVFTAFLTGFLG